MVFITLETWNVDKIHEHVYAFVIVNIEKSYTHLYNSNDAQICPAECTGEGLVAEDMMKYKNQNFSKGLNYKIYPRAPSKD